MSLNNKNIISATLEPDKLQETLAAFKVIKTNLPFIIALLPQERQSLSKMGDKTLAFVEKALGYLDSNPEFATKYANAEEAHRDFDLSRDLYTVWQAAAPLIYDLESTMMMAGSEAYEEARSYYDSVKRAAQSNEPGAKVIYEDLKKRFPGRTKKQKEQ